MRSDWRGDARNTSAPKRAMSNLEADAAIISIAQHARPKPIGQMDDSRAQFSTRSMLVVMKLSSNWCVIRPISVILLGLGARGSERSALSLQPSALSILGSTP